MPSKQFQALLKAIRTEDISQFDDFFLYYKEMEFLDLKDSEDFEEINDNREKCYYLALSKLLSLLSLYRGTGDEEVVFNEFSKLIDMSDKMGIFLEVKKIPFRLKIMAELHLDGMQKGLIGRVFVFIRFFNKYNLFEKQFSNAELELIKTIKKKDKALIANLKDLFDHVSDSLIYYSCKIMPYDLLLSNKERIRFYLNNREYRSELRGRYSLNYLKTWTDWYSMYGLSIRNLGSMKQFIDNFEKNYDGTKKVLEFNIIYRTFYFGDDEEHEFHEIKKHFVSPENIIKNKDKILGKNHYNFYSISMVLLGGLGPQGLGFTYSTPRGEVVEICSDQKENEAIIIKYKQYLKRKFLAKLEKEMEKLGIKENARLKVLDYLFKTLNPKNLISYYDKDRILRRIKKFLFQIEEFQHDYKSELEEILDKITKAISVILRDIKVKDQFITRMELVEEGKIKSEDVAKLTSLRGKSHHDVLRERFFFQNEIYWFFKDYAKEINELENQFLTL
ncbi:MAG: hypothetical protein KGD65_14970 [Candidatus Lokiarchaeota archaeon]|nr:hypothetical protein [Candidatus Lokiarchaeota archaeon]